MPLKLAILASGSGSNAQAIIDKSRAGILDASVELVFSNCPDAKVLERAGDAGVPTASLDHREYPSREEFDREVMEILARAGCQLIVLAGYMRLLGSAFLEKWPGAVINIHPALLPSFPGVHGAADAINYGVRISGPSVHFVEEKMDSGPLVIQAALPVLQDDTPQSLQMRIHELEHRIYPQAIQWIATGRLAIQGRKVMLEPAHIALADPIPNALVWPPLEKGF